MFDFPIDNALWWVSQGFAFIALVLVVVSFQQKEKTKLLWVRSFSVGAAFVGSLFLWSIPVVISFSISIVRIAFALYYAYKPNLKAWIKYGVCVFLFAALVAFNLVFWNGYLSVLSIIYGTLGIITFMQKNARLIRFVSLFFAGFGVVYFLLALSPISAIIDSIAFITAIVGIVRLDLKKKEKVIENNNFKADNLDTNKNVIE